MKINTKQLQLTYQDGAIRQVKTGNLEILRMIYPAIRDRNWGTIAPQIEKEKIETNENSFSIKYAAFYKEGDVDFVAEYSIHGKGDMVTFEMNGRAKRGFLKNRIGLCVLHPIKECAGNPFEVITPEGQKNKYTFPDQISPHQPAKNIKEMAWKVEGVSLNLKFEGDIFEMEDQRNWTDASYKTYSTPLEIPFPAQIKKNEKIHQKIILQVDGIKPVSEKQKKNVVIELAEEELGLPNLGFCQSTLKEQLAQHEAGFLKLLNPGHYRGDIHFLDKNWKEKCHILNEESIKLNTKLFLALHFTDDWKNELNEVKTCISINNYSPGYILLLDENTKTTTGDLQEIVAPVLKKEFPEIKIGGGVDANFAELNRSNLNAKNLDFVNFAISPQVHAFDDLSLVENLEGQKYTIESAKRLFPKKAIFVSPVTLRQRFNAAATITKIKSKKGFLPPAIDKRQSTLFNALWTLISLKYMTESGANLVSYFESVGDKGIIQGGVKPQFHHEETFQNMIFPIYNIFEVVQKANVIIKTKSNYPLKVNSVCFKFENTISLWVVNFSDEKQEIQLPKGFINCKRYDIQKGFETKDSIAKGITSDVAPGSLTIFEISN